MSIERTITLTESKELFPAVDILLTYQCSYHDQSFDHAFGREQQGGHQIDRWELTIAKKVLNWRVVTLDCLEVPDVIYDALNELCEKHLENNPITKDEQ